MMEQFDRAQMIDSLIAFGCIIDNALTNLIHIRNGNPYDEFELRTARMAFAQISDELNWHEELMTGATPLTDAFVESVELGRSDWAGVSHPFSRFCLSRGCMCITQNLHAVMYNRALVNASFLDTVIDDLAILAESSLMLARIAMRESNLVPFTSSAYVSA